MEVVVDGIIYQWHAHGGISRIYSEILPRMCAMDDTLRVAIVTPSLLRQSLPTHHHICYRRFLPVESVLRPSWLWLPLTSRIRASLQSRSLGHGQNKIWHSTYYTRLKGWTGKEVVTVADMIYERYPEVFDHPNDGFLRTQKRDCILNADAVLCISATTRRDLYDFYGMDLAKVQVIPLAHSPVFRALDKDSESLPMARPFLLYVGERARYKNFALLLQGYSVWPQRRDVDLVVVGRGWTRAEKRTLAESSATDSVYLLTGVDDEELVRLYNHAVAFVYPSLYEGFGIPLLEAMACGCPVVASHIPTTVEVAGENPIYFDPTEVESLLTALNAVYAEGRDSRRAALGLEHVKQYSWDRTAEQTLEVYRALSNVA